jgi:hypothetical protein
MRRGAFAMSFHASATNEKADPCEVGLCRLPGCQSCCVVFCAEFPAPRREVLLLYGSASFSKAAAALYSGYVTIFGRPSP